MLERKYVCVLTRVCVKKKTKLVLCNYKCVKKVSIRACTFASV